MSINLRLGDGHIWHSASSFRLRKLPHAVQAERNAPFEDLSNHPILDSVGKEKDTLGGMDRWMGSSRHLTYEMASRWRVMLERKA